jgi:hypothetical protein
MIFEYVGLQWTAGAVAVAWSTVGQADPVHRDAGQALNGATGGNVR